MLGSLPDRFSHTVFPPTFYQPFSAPNFANFPHLINIHKSILYQYFPTSSPTPLVLPLFLFFSQPALQPNMFVVSDSNPFTHFVVLLQFAHFPDFTILQYLLQHPSAQTAHIPSLGIQTKLLSRQYTLQLFTCLLHQGHMNYSHLENKLFGTISYRSNIRLFIKNFDLFARQAFESFHSSSIKGELLLHALKPLQS